MDPFATVPDLVARWRPLTPDEQTRAEVLLGDASTLVRGACWDNGKGFRIDDRLVPVPPETEPQLDSEIVKIIVCDMVRRAMQQGAAETLPDETSSLQQAAGPFSRSISFGPTGSSSGLFLTRRERGQLGISKQKAYTVDTMPEWAGQYPGYDREVDYVVDVLNGISGQSP